MEQNVTNYQGFKKPVFFKKSPAHWAFFKKRVFSKRPGLFKNPNLVDLGDVLLRFEGFKNMPDQRVL